LECVSFFSFKLRLVVEKTFHLPLFAPRGPGPRPGGVTRIFLLKIPFLSAFIPPRPARWGSSFPAPFSPLFQPLTRDFWGCVLLPEQLFGFFPPPNPLVPGSFVGFGLPFYPPTQKPPDLFFFFFPLVFFFFCGLYFTLRQQSPLQFGGGGPKDVCFFPPGGLFAMEFFSFSLANGRVPFWYYDPLFFSSFWGGQKTPVFGLFFAMVFFFCGFFFFFCLLFLFFGG